MSVAQIKEYVSIAHPELKECGKLTYSMVVSLGSLQHESKIYLNSKMNKSAIDKEVCWSMELMMAGLKMKASKLVRSIDETNFFDGTIADFTKCEKPASFVKFDYISTSGSRYYYADGGVYRYSNHWGGCATCMWTLNGNSSDLDLLAQRATSYQWGFCKFSDFKNA